MAARTTPGDKVAAVASAALQAGFEHLHIAVRAAAKGERASKGVRSVRVRILGFGNKVPDGWRLNLGPADMAVAYWEKAGIESAAEPVAMTDDQRPDGTTWLPGLASAVGRVTSAHEGERRVVVVLGIERVALAKLVSMSDVFGQARYEVIWRVP